MDGEIIFDYDDEDVRYPRVEFHARIVPFCSGNWDHFGRW